MGCCPHRNPRRLPGPTEEAALMLQQSPKFSIAWCMPSKWTFSMPPVSQFLDRWLDGCDVVADPFSGRSTRASLRNDLGFGGIHAEDFCKSLDEASCDAVLFDPPYSPRQISECYKSIGLKAAMADTQNGALYARVRAPLLRALKPGGIALSFGWQSSGFGRALTTLEVLLVQHGGAHNDTICVAQRKPRDLFS